jgi:DNA repair exonuclease SbcCD nuclease subunit
MKILVTSDWHLDAKTLGKWRFAELSQTITSMVDKAIAKDIHLFVFMGDLMDPEVQPITYRVYEFLIGICRRLDDAGITSIWLTGNHDVMEDGLYTSTLTPLKGLQKVSKVEDWVQLPKSEVVSLYPGDISVCDSYTQYEVFSRDKWSMHKILCLPYTHSTVVSPSEWLKKVEIGGHYVFGHLMIEGVILGDESTDFRRGSDRRLPTELLKGCKVFNGHYHKSQVYKKDDVDIHIPGSLARLSFNEVSHKPSYLIVDV